MKVEQIITNQIIEMIEAGNIPWDKPFHGVPPMNLRGTGYRGINLLILSVTSVIDEFKSPIWLTFNQCRNAGGKIKKGSHGVKIVFWKQVEKKKKLDTSTSLDSGSDNPESEGSGPGSYPILRYYTVFNLDQTEGIPDEKLPPIPDVYINEWDPVTEAEKFIESIPGVEIRYSHNDKAFYTPHDDYIHIPERSYFQTPEGYYATHFHEIGHWTGHKSRLNRDLKPLMLSKHDYSFEELIAELTSAFLCGKFNLVKDTIRNHAAYIQGWVSVLKNDPKMIIRAASKAQKAFDYLEQLTGGENEKITPDSEKSSQDFSHAA